MLPGRVPGDPIETLRGSYTALGLTTEEARRADRSAEAASEERRQADAVTVLDAYAVIAYLRGKSATEEVAALMRSTVFW